MPHIDLQKLTQRMDAEKQRRDAKFTADKARKDVIINKRKQPKK